MVVVNMKNLFLEMKIKKEMKRFKQFKEYYNFSQKELRVVDNAIYCEDICIKGKESDEIVGETDNIINVGYKNHGSATKLLSNLFPYNFYFRGHNLSCAESFFQGIKFKDKKAQRLVFKMSGTDCNNIKFAQDYNWKEERFVYFMGKKIDRFAKEYESMVDELYVSMLLNPLFVNALKNVGEKYIMHSIGLEDKNETVFTRYEFEKQLNCLKDYCIMYK